MTRVRASAALLPLALPLSLAGALIAAAPVAASPTGPAASTRSVAGPVTRTDGAGGAGERGAWQVDDLGAGRYQVAWTSPVRLPVRSDRPTIAPAVDGAAITVGDSTIDADGRTVHAVVTAASPPTAAQLDVLLSGDRLDRAGDDVVARRAPAAPASAYPALSAPDPGATGPYATTTSDYTLPSVKLRGMRQPIEMVGHVVEPEPGASTGPRPLVLFLHGRHEVCYNPSDPDDYSDAWPCVAPSKEIPSQLGYDYIQRTLASQGYATVSIRVNGINAQDYRLDDGGAEARAQIVQRHLDHWADIAAAHDVDMDEVVLVGHSRGGEGVDRASIEIPADAPYTVIGQVLLAPTDFASHTAPYVPTVTVLPYCDGDVYDLQGQRFTDTARDLAAGDTSLKSSVLVMGANHNFFNTEWTPGVAQAPSFDDWGGDPRAACGRKTPERLKAASQRSVGTAYVAGAVKLFLGDDAYLPMFDGSQVSVPSTGDAVVHSAAIGGGRDLRRPGIDARPSLPSSGASGRLCGGTTTADPSRFGACGRKRAAVVTPNWRTDGERVPERRFLEAYWSRAGAVVGLSLDRPLDLSGGRLDLRAIVDPRIGDAGFDVRITDGAGASATLTPDGGTVAALPAAQGVTKLWAQGVVVDVGGASGVDLADVVKVELVGTSSRGRVWIADLGSAPSALPAVPDTRAPAVQIGDLTRTEGDRRTNVARVPFTIDGAVTAPSRFVALTVGDTDVRRIVVDVAPGQTHGSIPVAYAGNRTFDTRRVVQVTAYPLRGLATDRYTGRLTVTDDDPAPVVTVQAPRRVVEGHPAVFRLTVDQAFAHRTYVDARVVRGSGRPVRGADVAPDWFARHGTPGQEGVSLWRSYVYLGGIIRQGAHTYTVQIPTRADGAAERAETLTVRFEAFGQVVKRTVRVVDAR